MSRKLTKFTCYLNTPFTDFQNTLNYPSKEQLDNFFDTHYERGYTEKNFNFVRDRGTLRVPASEQNPWEWWSQVNLVSWVSDFDGIRYYAQVTDANYLNDGVIELHLVIDGLLTFCQGDISKYAGNVQIEREHLPRQLYRDLNGFLRTNDDTLKFNNMRYMQSEYNVWGWTALSVVFRSSVDLEAAYGNENNPKTPMAKGQTLEGVTSPQNVYTVANVNAPQIFKYLQNYSWIAQNITDVKLVPNSITQTIKMHPIKMNNGAFDTSNVLSEFDNNAMSKDLGTAPGMDYTQQQVLDWLLGADNTPDYDFLLRKGYVNLDMTNYQGQDIDIDTSYLNDGLHIKIENITGYDNVLAFYPENYKAVEGNPSNASYLDNALIFKDFDSEPLLVNTGQLDWASHAHERNLERNNTITGLAGNVMNPHEKLEDRMMSAVSIMSDAQPSAIMGKLTDEWQLYRKQNAQHADTKIEKPAITEQSTNNAFNVKHNAFGCWLRYSRLDDYSLGQIVNYHSNFGFALNFVSNLAPIDSMSYMNYAKFKGNWEINDKNVPQSIMEQIRVQLENGVKFWHNPDNVDFPFREDIKYKNRMVK